MRALGTVVMGVRTPIIRVGDDLVGIVAESIIAASKAENIPLRDRDIVAVTEAVVARAQGNYATVEQIAEDVRHKFACDTLGVVFPITSRNRFAVCLRGIAMAVKKVVLMLSYPSDEFGNHLVSADMLEESGVNPWSDTLSEKDFRRHFGYPVHFFTGMDYISFYKSVIEESGAEAEIIFSNNAKSILEYTDNVLACDVHTRARTLGILRGAGAKKALGMADILNAPVNGSGYNEDYGLLGTNVATHSAVKIFPRDCQSFVDKLAAALLERTGKRIEVMIYGDHAIKDPQEKIWELADPVVSPAYTPGLEGVPNEIKMKYLADNKFKDLSGAELEAALKDFIAHKNDDLVGKEESMGTTPRKLTDLIGSLCDLTSGSGDKGTPVVWIQGYFDNFSMDD